MAEKRVKPTFIGGQAALEGVMMRGKRMYALAVRTPDKHIDIRRVDFGKKRNKLLNLPIIRGIWSFLDSLIMGTKIIYDSAEMSGMDDLTEEKPSKFDKWLEKTFGDKLFEYIMMFSVVIAIGLGIIVFMLVPVGIAGLINRVVGLNRYLLSITEGLLRIGIFVVYIALISKMKDIQRTFQYHGAEHKTINCYESGDELTPENAIKHTRLHKRCGTSFLLIVMVISMIFFFFFKTPNIWLRLGSRILFVPIIAGISYEVIRWAGRSDNRFVNIISTPGMWLQKLTTKEPDLEQVEVAIAAMKTVLHYELGEGEPYTPAQAVVQESACCDTEPLCEVDSVD